MKVLFAASECAPIVKVGGLGDVVGSLPKALAKQGVSVAVIIPKYKIPGFSYPETLPGTDIPVFYVENDAYFGDGSVYPGGEPEHERFAYFSRAVVEFLDTRAFESEVIHCHDYHTALIPDILKEQRKKIATVLTIHDLSNKGISSSGILDTALLSSSTLRVLDYDLADQNVAMILQGLISSDVINTVSPTYAREIMTAERGEGFDEVLRGREARVFGILNGLDTDEFNPATDVNLVARFPECAAQAIEKGYLEGVLMAKRANKEALQKKLGLKTGSSVPLISMITRLVERKGVGLLMNLLKDEGFANVQFVILGRGDPHIEEELVRIAKAHPSRISVQILFDEDLAHLIYGSSDLFLVPSVFEPCGLTQMVAMRYGAVPVVHQTGGLADSVEDGLTGFTFNPYGYEPFQKALNLALEAFKSGRLATIMGSGLKKDYSWDKSGKKYIRLYEKALEYKFGIARGVGGELRSDVWGEWTVLSTLRQGRPDETGVLKDKSEKLNLKIYEPHSTKEEIENCPFEEGHESMSAGEVFRTGGGSPDQPGWLTRVVPNKYPIVPAHEVIIHSPAHERDLELLDSEEMENLVWTYLSRYRHYEQFGYVHLFCNRGREAAASLKHPHSQLIVLDELAKSTIEALQTADGFYRSYGLCPYCDLIRREIGGPRFVWENDSFVVLTPFSSDWPYELTIVPKTHRKSFGNIKDKEMKDFAHVLQMSISALSMEIKNISYNFWIHSLPTLLGLEKTSLYYHWHLDLVPRVKLLGGVELGLKLMINDRISPEDAAQKLKSHLSFK